MCQENFIFQSRQQAGFGVPAGLQCADPGAAAGGTSRGVGRDKDGKVIRGGITMRLASYAKPFGLVFFRVE